MERPDNPRLAAWPEHRRILTAAIDHFRTDLRVLGLLLGGSFAAGTPDVYSDIDLYIIVRDDLFDQVLGEKTGAAAAGGRVLTAFVPDHLGPGGDEMYIAVYDGPVKLDLNYERRSSVKPAWKLSARAVLMDRDGSLAETVAASRGLTAPPPSVDALEALHDKFWTWCWYVFGKIARGEVWEARGGLEDIRRLALLPLLLWDANKPAEGYRRLESRLKRDVRDRLTATVAGLDAAPLYRALQAAMDVFEELHARLYPRYGLPCDRTAGRAIRSAIERAWSSRPKPAL
jgi:predicted nucleotidyltransferase